MLNTKTNKMKSIYSINGNRIEIVKNYRTRTQYEYYLTIFIGDSDYESISNYKTMFLTKSSALNEANKTIIHAKKPRIEKVTL